MPARAQPIAHSAVLSSPMMGLLGDNRLAAGHDLGRPYLRAARPPCAKHGQTASATGPSDHRGVRIEDADPRSRHCVACTAVGQEDQPALAQAVGRWHGTAVQLLGTVGYRSELSTILSTNWRRRQRRRKYDAVSEGRVGTYRGPQTFGVMQDGTGKAPLTLGDPQLVEQSLALYVR